MTHSGRARVRENLYAFRGVADLVICAGLGFALFLATFYAGLRSGKCMPAAMQRITNVGAFLQPRAGVESSRNDVYLLGSSVLIEGIDCDILSRQLLPGQRAFNLGWTGGSLRQIALAIRAAARPRPAAVVLCLLPGDLIVNAGIPRQRAALAAWGGLVTEADIPALRSILTETETEALSASIARQLLICRAFPLGSLDERFRELARTDLRYEGYAENFTAPWIMRSRVSETALKRHLNALSDTRSIDWETLPATLEESGAVLSWCIRQIRETGTRAIVVIVPQHPHLLGVMKEAGLWESCLTVIRRACSQEGGELIDHSELLDASLFADAVHPYAPGRERWSTELGRALAGGG